MDHVKNLRWHAPSQKDQKLWEKQINRKDFKVSKWTVVCSNHFAAGYYSDVCNIPTLCMKGYDVQQSTKRKEPADRSLAVNQQPPKRSRNTFRNGITQPDDLPQQTPAISDHD